MAKDKPKNNEALLSINGIGETKLNRYGEAFLGVIDKFHRETQAESYPPGQE